MRLIMATRESERPGWIAESGYTSPIETPAGYLARGEGVTLYCTAAKCHHYQEVDMAALVAKGWGDVPISEFRGRWSCSACGTPLPKTIRDGFGDR
jgi:hypothetical protein